MEVIGDPDSMSSWSRSVHRRGDTVGFVPTMGALHDGHRSLVTESTARCGATVVSIFVNPTQFDDRADFENYPTTLEADLDVCRAAGVDAVYLPSVEVMYPPGSSTTVDPGPIGAVLEGRHRPGHFTGVATVVVKLLGAVRPDVAYFGEKDFQQVAVLRRVVADLDLGVRIVALPTVREPDGLAMSSRNTRLDPAARDAATVIHRALLAGARSLRGARIAPADLIGAIESTLATEPLCRTDYVALVDPTTLVPWTGEGPVAALVAARFGDIRLIDNMVLSDWTGD